MKKVALTYVIDDDKIFRFVMNKQLERHEAFEEVQLFDKATLALHALEHAPAPNLIFIDLNMPEMNCWAFLEALQKLDHLAVPIIILSASINPQDQLRADQHPQVLKFISKPLDHESIQQILAQL